MKLMNHDLKDEWILDSGATNHMTGNPELLDGTKCLVPSISVYLGNNEKLMATRIGSFKSPMTSIPVLVVPGLNVNLISCAQLCTDRQCWIVLNVTRDYLYDKGGNKLCSLQTLRNLFILEGGLQSKSRCLVAIFSKGNIDIWHRRLGHASVETLRKLGFHGDLDDCNICSQGKLKHSKFSRRTFYAQQLLERVHSDFMGPFIEGYWREKCCLLFVDEMSRKAFIKTLKSRSEVATATLKLFKKEQRRIQTSLVYLRNDGAKDYKMKVLQDFLRQEGISHEVTERYSNGQADRSGLF
jgi:hypothetical protein